MCCDCHVSDKQPLVEAKDGSLFVKRKVCFKEVSTQSKLDVCETVAN